ncbi:MAG: hypothetical protein ACI9F9_002056, partial [Candidatus Paceibacteria bacterium]
QLERAQVGGSRQLILLGKGLLVLRLG